MIDDCNSILRSWIFSSQSHTIRSVLDPSATPFNTLKTWCPSRDVSFTTFTNAHSVSSNQMVGLILFHNSVCAVNQMNGKSLFFQAQERTIRAKVSFIQTNHSKLPSLSCLKEQARSKKRIWAQSVQDPFWPNTFGFTRLDLLSNSSDGFWLNQTA